VWPSSTDAKNNNSSHVKVHHLTMTHFFDIRTFLSAAKDEVPSLGVAQHV